MSIPVAEVHMRGKGAYDDAAAAGDIEDRVARLGLRRLDNHAQRILVGDRRGGAEQRRLPGELVEDQVLMPGRSHAFSLERPIGQHQHLAVSAALLRADQRRADLLDRVGRVDRRLEHAVAELDGEIGIERADLLRRALGEAAAEIEAGQVDAAQIDAPRGSSSGLRRDIEP